jgi:DNA-binding response OmpR family regulator
MRVLLVEDEKYIDRAVAEVLKKNHYAVDMVFRGDEALAYASTGIYDLVILDIMLPGMDGLSVLRKLRAGNITAPVILLTARTSLEDTVPGLDAGADDYLPKPFHTDELLARIRALGRRNIGFAVEGRLDFGDLSLEPQALTLTLLGDGRRDEGCGGRHEGQRDGWHEGRCGGRNDGRHEGRSEEQRDGQRNGGRNEGRCERLGLKATQLLELLIVNAGAVVPKETMLRKLWGYDVDVDNNHVEAHISLLRKALAAIGSSVSIRTVRGVGYALMERPADPDERRLA